MKKTLLGIVIENTISRIQKDLRLLHGQTLQMVWFGNYFLRTLYGLDENSRVGSPEKTMGENS